MQHVDVCGEIRFYDGPAGLLDLIEEKLGLDTREALVEFIEEAIDILTAGKRIPRLSEKDREAVNHPRGAL
jgi:hypothetical protein